MRGAECGRIELILERGGTLQVSLNQIGPLMYEVLGPNEVFERRW